MKLIPLTQGQFAKVDDADFDWLSQWKWTAQKASRTFYAMRRDKRKLVMMHRFINETPDGLVTDHVDGDGLNNQRINLRNATLSQNSMNSKPQRGRTSVLKGVFKDDKGHNRKLWRSAIRINGRVKYLGRFNTETEAADAYAKAAPALFGQFHRIDGE